MSSTTILAPIVLTVLGIIFGTILAVASKVFAVEKDPREDAIVEILPGANCGGCGYPGCGGYASAVVAGTAPVNACSPGGAATAAKIGEIMGVAAGSSGASKIAQVHVYRRRSR
ncbi:MAG: RnfABCDGE type electron transport complex subunit B [Evtepia sp.]